MSNIIPFADKRSMADAIVKSKFYGFQNAEQIMALMFVAEAENKHIATVVQEYDVISGRPALKTQAVLARFQQAGGKVQWKEMTPEKCVGVFSHHAGGDLTVEWTMEMAHIAGLVRPGSGWTKYPEDMLRARCIARGVRSVYPACILGQYSVEEVQDFEPKTVFPKSVATKSEINMGALEPLETVEEIVVDRAVEGLTNMPDDIPPGKFALMLPDGTVYSTHDTNGEWCVAYVNVTNRIFSSEKLTPAAKQEKIDAFRKANEQFRNQLPLTDRLALTQMVDQGHQSDSVRSNGLEKVGE